MSNKKFIGCFLITAALISSGWCQEEVTVSKKYKNPEKFEAGKLRISPATVPLYSPELGFNLTAGLLMSFKTRPNNPYLSHSCIPLSFAYNFKGDILSRATAITNWFDDLLRIDCDIEYQHLSDDYYGIGIDQIETTQENGYPTEYLKTRFVFDPSLMIMAFNDFYTGLNFNFSQTKANELNNSMLEDLTILQQGTEIKNIGLGARINYALRLLPANIAMLFDIQYKLFSKSIGSTNSYSQFVASYNLQAKLRGARIFHLFLNTENNFGNVPWTDMAFLGNQNLLSGLHHEKYRDKSLFYAAIHVNQQLPELKNINLSKHSVLLGFGGGAVYGSSPDNPKMIFQYKLGYEYEYQPGFKLSLNVGITNESSGIYLNFYKVL